MTATAWQPGDRLYATPGVYIRPMFQLIEMDDYDEPTLDSARWPEPHGRHVLKGADE